MVELFIERLEALPNVEVVADGPVVILHLAVLPVHFRFVVKVVSVEIGCLAQTQQCACVLDGRRARERYTTACSSCAGMVETVERKLDSADSCTDSLAERARPCEKASRASVGVHSVPNDV